MISWDKVGGRTIHLFIPFEYKGKKVESIVLAPFCFGHTLRWAEGDWKTSLGLLVELAEVDEAVIRSLRFPDADRVMEAFMAMLPPEIRQDIAEGHVPTKQEKATPEQQLAETTKRLEEITALAQARAQQANGGGDQPINMQGPGIPLPEVETETGFDLSDEP